MNPDNVNAEALRLLKELHTKLVLQRKKMLLYNMSQVYSKCYFNQSFFNFYFKGFTLQYLTTRNKLML